MGKVMNTSTVKQRLIASLPLVPVLSGGSFLIAALSPISWTGNNFNPVIGVLAISFGVVSAYCVVMFVEACKDLKP
jgi:hypothetical protein